MDKEENKTELLIAMSDGSKFTVKSTLPFEQAVADIMSQESSICLIEDVLAINVLQIVSITDAVKMSQRDDKSKEVPIRLSRGGKISS